MSEVKSYLDKEGLATFIDLIKLNFKTRKEAYLDAGLKLSRLNGSSFENTKNDNAAYNGKICQSTYYVNADKISSFDLGDYICTDPNIMGEVVIQFVPNQDMSIDEVSFPNATVLWKNEDYIYMSEGETYQIRFTTDNEKRDDGKYLILADLLNYSKWTLPGGGGNDGGGNDGDDDDEITDPETMDNCVCITYKSSEATIPLVSWYWISGLDAVYKKYISGIYYCSNYDASKSDRDQDFKILTYDNLKTNRYREIKNNAKLIVKFTYGKNIYLKQMLEDINFDTIYFYELNGDLITDMDYMLSHSGGSGAVAATSIDFTGIVNVTGNILYADKCRNLLRNRLTYNPTGMALKMFGGQYNDTEPYNEECGIMFSKLTDMTGIFDGCIRESTGTQEEITKLINRIRTVECSNFTCMFRNCYLADADFSSYKMKPAADMRYTGMFKGAKFKTNDSSKQLNTLNRFLVPGSRGSDGLDKTSTVYYNEMFSETSLSDYSGLLWDGTFCTLSSKKFGSYSFAKMFAGCKNLYKVPILKINNVKSVVFDGMFSDACKNVNKPDFSNMSKWTVLVGNSTDYNNVPTLSFNSMFSGCNLKSFNNTNPLNFFTTASQDRSTYTTVDVYNMPGFNNMFTGSGVGVVKLNLYSIKGSGVLPNSNDDPIWGQSTQVYMLSQVKTMFDNDVACIVDVPYDTNIDNSYVDIPGNLFRVLNKCYDWRSGTKVGVSYNGMGIL